MHCTMRIWLCMHTLILSFVLCRWCAHYFFSRLVRNFFHSALIEKSMWILIIAATMLCCVVSYYFHRVCFFTLLFSTSFLFRVAVFFHTLLPYVGCLGTLVFFLTTSIAASKVLLLFFFLDISLAWKSTPTQLTLYKAHYRHLYNTNAVAAAATTKSF